MEDWMYAEYGMRADKTGSMMVKGWGQDNCGWFVVPPYNITDTDEEQMFTPVRCCSVSVGQPWRSKVTKLDRVTERKATLCSA